ncbi:hypothetical protein KC19_VG232500 [Ceratodon purpureus]|uniref:Uncharacterized protein n=1 Tax=Ceratodon purpureus TaxID=3225 RepID=A0A8T0HSW6_CERPU|nr:hypothetical protein KC19_VG232500 [Ceratodon purpureus]
MADLDASSSTNTPIPIGTYAPSWFLLSHNSHIQAAESSGFTCCSPFVFELSTMFGSRGAGSPSYANRTPMSRPNQTEASNPSPHTASNSTPGHGAIGDGRARSSSGSPSMRGCSNPLADCSRMRPIRPRVTYAPSGTTALVVAPPRPRQTPCPIQRDVANAAMRQQRQHDQAAYGEMRAAHAQVKEGMAWSKGD